MNELVRAENATLATPEEQVLLRMQAARQQLSEAKTIGDAKRIADGAAAICEWLRRQSELGLEIRNDAQLLKLQAEARMGEFLQRPGAVKADGRPRKPFTEDTVSPPTHKDLGLSRIAAKQYREVASVSGETLADLAEKATRSGRELTRKSVLKVAARLKPRPLVVRDEMPAEAGPECAGIPEAFRNAVVTGDARKLARQLPDNSVAVCLCDPVYDRIEDYEWLARECERVLVPGGNLIAQCGNMRRFLAEEAMRRSGLSFVDLLAEVYPYALCPLYPIRVQVGWKPYLWFSKGPRRGEWMMNRVAVGGKSYSDASKDIHPWGDGEQFSGGVLQKLCEPGDVVWDPFTGSGTVPVVAKRLGLPFVAFEINPESADAAQDRLCGTRRETSPQQSLWSDEE